MKIKCKEIAREVKKIRVRKLENENVAVENESAFEMIGKGREKEQRMIEKRTGQKGSKVDDEDFSHLAPVNSRRSKCRLEKQGHLF